MLRNVLGVYLDNVHEKDLYLPFITLLSAMDFHDIHFTHGQTEFGKDFIAKRVEDGLEIQYSFQLKAGDISQSDWRNTVMGQMLESVANGLSHPNFNSSLPHQSVLVTTGYLKGNAAASLDQLNEKIVNSIKARPIVLWAREQLMEKLEAYGLGGLHSATGADFVNYGNFYRLYGMSLMGSISERQIERHSRQWLNKSIGFDSRVFCAAIESEILAAQCIRNGFVYEAIHAYLSCLRIILNEIHDNQDLNKVQELLQIYEQAIEKLYYVCKSYIDGVQQIWISQGKDFIRAIHDSSCMISYLVHCARILEISGYVYFLEHDASERKKILEFIKDFIEQEPGCAHTPSDRYAISLVLPVIVLHSTSQTETAMKLLRKATIWLCDRYQEGCGLASFESDQYTEIATLFGYPFEFIKIRSSGASFLATVLSDLAAFLGERQFYSDVINDIMATGISRQYWQAGDTESLFSIEGPNVVIYSNVEYSDALTEFNSYDFAEHIKREPRSFKVVEKVGAIGLISIMLLLRDRYFPTLWDSIAKRY